MQSGSATGTNISQLLPEPYTSLCSGSKIKALACNLLKIMNTASASCAAQAGTTAWRTLSLWYAWHHKHKAVQRSGHMNPLHICRGYCIACMLASQGHAVHICSGYCIACAGQHASLLRPCIVYISLGQTLTPEAQNACYGCSGNCEPWQLDKRVNMLLPAHKPCSAI